MKTLQSNHIFFGNVIAGTIELIDSIKLILYKKYPTIFDE